MNEFVDIFAQVLRIVTFQPREARMRYRAAEWEERMHAPDGRRDGLGAKSGVEGRKRFP